MYTVKAYWYPQCNAGLYPVYNCRVSQLNNEYQSRKDGLEGTDIMIPIVESWYSAAMYSQDDIRNDKYLIVLFRGNQWLLCTHTYVRFHETYCERRIFKNNELVDQKTVIPKIILLFWKWYNTYEKNEQNKILEQIDKEKTKFKLYGV